MNLSLFSGHGCSFIGSQLQNLINRISLNTGQKIEDRKAKKNGRNDLTIETIKHERSFAALLQNFSIVSIVKSFLPFFLAFRYIIFCPVLRTYPSKNLRCFWGSFEPIFDSFCRGSIRS